MGERFLNSFDAICCHSYICSWIPLTSELAYCSSFIPTCFVFWLCGSHSVSTSHNPRGRYLVGFLLRASVLQDWMDFRGGENHESLLPSLRQLQSTFLTMMRFSAFISLALVSCVQGDVLSLTAANWEEKTAGKTVFVKVRQICPNNLLSRMY